MLRSLDLFSGVGAFALGLERSGLCRPVAFCEIDPYASKVLAKHWPEVPNFHDVRTLTARQLVALGIFPNAIGAGFPCQDISGAGLCAGLEGERSGLFFEIIRLVREFAEAGHPIDLVLLENVSALLGRGLGDVLGALASVGFDAEWDCIPASHVGAPHRRDRIWIATHPRGEQHEGGRAPLSGSIAAQLSGAHPDAAGERCGEARELRRDQPEERLASMGEAVAGTASCGRREGHTDTGRRGKGARTAKERQGFADRGWWLAEPNVGRVANGIPKRVDRLKCLGNAVVPQIPELIGNAILASLSEQRRAA